MRAIDEIFDVHDGQGKPLERRGSLQLRVEVRAIIVERGVLRSAETKDGKREDVRVFVTAEKLVADAQLVAIGLLGLHYKFAYEQMESKALCLAGLAGYFVILGVSKGFELGFPKDTGAEQVVALQDETYSAHHLVLHGCLVANLAITAFPSPATKATPAAGRPGKDGLSAAKAE